MSQTGSNSSPLSLFSFGFKVLMWMASKISLGSLDQFPFQHFYILPIDIMSFTAFNVLSDRRFGAGCFRLQKTVKSAIFWGSKIVRYGRGLRPCATHPVKKKKKIEYPGAIESLRALETNTCQHFSPTGAQITPCFL